MSEAFSTLEQWLGLAVPSNVREAVLHFGGLSFDSGLTLYAVEDLLERNQTYETTTYCPGYLALGDDGGGRAVVVALERKGHPLFLVDHGVMSEDAFAPLAATLADWLHNGMPL